MLKILVILCLVLSILSQPTNRIDINNNFSLSISLNNDKIKFDIVMKVFGYIGFGFGPTMQGTDMIITQLNNDNSYNIMDDWSSTEDMPKTDVSLGGTYDILNPEINKFDDLSTGFKISFERYLNTGDVFDYPIIDGVPIDISVVWLEQSALDYHGNNKLFSTVIYNKAKATLLFDPSVSTSSTNQFFNIHGISRTLLIYY